MNKIFEIPGVFRVTEIRDYTKGVGSQEVIMRDTPFLFQLRLPGAEAVQHIELSDAMFDLSLRLNKDDFAAIRKNLHQEMAMSDAMFEHIANLPKDLYKHLPVEMHEKHKVDKVDKNQSLEEALIRVKFLEGVLVRITEIKNQMDGPDWEEIKEAREVASGALIGILPPMKDLDYEPNENDVENVLRSNFFDIANSEGKSFEEMANNIFPLLDFEKIEQAASLGDDMDEKADFGNDEIATQLRAMGVLNQLKQNFNFNFNLKLM